MLDKAESLEKAAALRVDDVTQAGHLANQEDHELTAIQAIKAHPWTVFWCVYAIWVLISTSFENQAGGSVLGIPQFRQDFGYKFEDGYVLSASWQSAFSGAPVASAVIGSLGIGSVADTIGRKGAYAVAIIFSIMGIALELVATTNPIFFAGKFINGFAIGSFIAISFTYIGEVAPVALRGILSSAAAIAFTLGPFLVALIVNGTGDATTRWAYRAIFVAQFGVLAVAIAGLPFMPESPWWLLNKGRQEKAVRSLKKLGYSSDEIERRVAAIVLTLEEVRRETEGVTYFECFRRSNLRRTFISIAPLSIQALSGVYFASAYSTYYYQLAGYSTGDSFKLQIVQQVISLIGNVCAWFLIDKVGRRPLIFYGLLLLTVVLLITGGLAAVGTPAALKGTCALILFYCFAYNVTIGASAFTILTETSTSRLRVKTIAIGNALQNSIFTMWAFVIPYLFNPDQANLGAKVSFIFGGLAIICLVYLWFCQPETAGRTYEELDEMFINKIPARKFKNTTTEAEMKGKQAREVGTENSTGLGQG